MNEQHVEEVARVFDLGTWAMLDAATKRGRLTPGLEIWKKEAIVKARAAIKAYTDALEASGLQIVPKEATEDMRKAWHGVEDKGWAFSMRYKAMLSASEKEMKT